MLIAVVSACTAWTQSDSDHDDWQLLPLSDGHKRRVLRMSPLGDPPPDGTNRVADDVRAAELGQSLFFDERLSSTGTISCATCHDPKHGFSNGSQFGDGISQTQRHVPTLLNVAHHQWFYWDGRADTLWAQALRPVEHDDEMGFDRVGVARLIARDEQCDRNMRRSLENCRKRFNRRSFRQPPSQCTSHATICDIAHGRVCRILSET